MTLFHLLLACLFSRSDSDLGQTSVIGLKITITCTLPIQLPIRQLPPFKREEVILGTSTEPGLVWMVFVHLREAGLKLKPAKCALFRQILAMWNMSPNGVHPLLQGRYSNSLDLQAITTGLSRTLPTLQCSCTTSRRMVLLFVDRGVSECICKYFAMCS